MILCAVDSIAEDAAPPTEVTIERERQQQMQALQNVRRQLARSAGSGGILLQGIAPPQAGEA